MIKDMLSTEIERQKKTLDRLPSDFVYPLFNSRHAVESQRRSGYRNTASAAREIVDNALEAGASRIDIVFERPKRLTQHERKDSVRSVAFIDNGSGMLPEMARYALSWGAGTHFDEPGTIGKFGFGLPNASINQTRRVEVYTKIRDAERVMMAWLDINETKEYGVQTIDPPVEQDLPEFVQRYLKTNNLTFDHGTVVVWCKPDRLTYKMAAPLKEHLLDDFGVTYRYMLSGITLIIEGVEVYSIDPLFLTPGARFYQAPEEGGALLQGEWTIPVRYVRRARSLALSWFGPAATASIIAVFPRLKSAFMQVSDASSVTSSGPVR
jgi:histidine kinase/DNA gyrase B/HSP90-like ATPase